MKQYFIILYSLCFLTNVNAQTGNPYYKKEENQLIEVHPDSIPPDAAIISSKYPETNADTFKIIEASVKEEPKVFTFVEQMPEFPGGEKELMKFLQQNITYPQMERDNDIQGKVYVKFVVNEDGSVSNVEIVRSVSPGLDKEAARVVKMLPNFKPGRQQGVPVRVYFILPIVFKLEDQRPKGMNMAEEKLLRDRNFKLAVDQMKLNNYSSALKYLKESIKEFPNDYLSYDLKAECELKLNKTKDACKSAQKAKDKGSPNADEFLKKNCK